MSPLLLLFPMAHPKYPNGKHIRWTILLGIILYTAYFIIDTILNEPPDTRIVYICDTSGNDNSDTSTAMTQCLGPEDVTTCTNLFSNGDGNDNDSNDVPCIASSCGYKLFPHIDISIAGSSDPFNANAATLVSIVLDYRSYHR